MRCRPRKLSAVQQAFLQAKTNIMVRQGKLEDSHGQWSHGLVLVAYEDRIKKFMDEHGDQAMKEMFKVEHEDEVATFFRLCIDLRMLNSKTIPDIYPLPRIDDLVESIPRGCGRFSISDICDAFFTCELKKEHRPKTAFKTHDRHLQFAVLSQGFINSPSIFCRLIARTFKGIERSKFSAYIDDVLNTLKRALATKPVLMSIDSSKPFRLKIDACRKGRGIGCILEQPDDDGKWHPVSYYSTSLSGAEREYSATELECKALHDCVLHYATYLKYIPHFEVFTDHNVLRIKMLTPSQDC